MANWMFQVTDTPNAPQNFSLYQRRPKKRNGTKSKGTIEFVEQIGLMYENTRGGPPSRATLETFNTVQMKERTRGGKFVVMSRDSFNLLTPRYTSFWHGFNKTTICNFGLCSALSEDRLWKITSTFFTNAPDLPRSRRNMYLDVGR